MKLPNLHRMRDFGAGAITAALVLGLVIPAGAAMTSKTIQVLTGADIYIDGAKLNPTDANGNPVETFVYNGTTYVPLRAVSQSLGKAVNWDGENQRVYIGNVPGTTQYLNDVSPAYQVSAPHRVKFSETFSMAGKEYEHGMTCQGEGYALYNLDGKYTSLSFVLGRVDSVVAGGEASMKIELDGKVALEKELPLEMMPETVEVPLDGAKQMKISFTYEYPETVYGLGEMVVK